MLEESTGNFSATRNIYDWYQTNTHVIINIMIKNLKEADVKVKLIDETLDVTCNLADGSIFKLHFNLFKPIYVQDSNWSVTPSKLEIKLKKTDRKRWQSLEQIPEKNNKRHSHQQQHTNSGYNNSGTIQKAQVTVTGCNNSEPPSKPKHDWYQSETHVVIVVHIRNLNPDDVRVQFEEVHLEVGCKCEDGAVYKLELGLHKPITPEESEFSLTASKLEIRMKKATKGRWPNLEAVPEVIRNALNTSKSMVKSLSTTMVEMVEEPTPLPIESIPDGANFETVESTPVENDLSQDSQSKDRAWEIIVKDVEEVVGGEESKSMGLDESVNMFQDENINQKDNLTSEKVVEEHVSENIVDNLTTMENAQVVTQEDVEVHTTHGDERYIDLQVNAENSQENLDSIQLAMVEEEMNLGQVVEQVVIKSDSLEDTSEQGKLNNLTESREKSEEIVQRALENEGLLGSGDIHENDSDEEPCKKSRLKSPEEENS